MKNSLYFRRSPVKFLIPVVIITGFIFASCNNATIKNNSFYYSGNTKIEIDIISDTLGILLKDTVLYPYDTSRPYFDKVIETADSALQNQGYLPAGNLEKDPHIKLVLNKNKKLTKNGFLDQLNELRTLRNRAFVANAGYLVRIKGTNKPMILTDEIVIVFKQGATRSAIDSVFDSYKLNVLRRSRFDSLQYTVAVTKNTPHDVLKMSHLLKDNNRIRLAQLNFIYAKKYLSVQPTDDLFNQQWSLMNDRPDATEDADIDADLAWDFTMGSADIILAVIDEGFDTLHPDLSPNFLINNAETQGNHIDDDRNGFIDDYLGWNFDGDDNNLDGYNHGTAVIGLANAVRDDVTGIVGSCPGCRSLLLKSGHTVQQDAETFLYAQLRGVKIINCSWEVSSFEPLFIDAINTVINAGITVVFAMANGNRDYCSGTPGIIQPSGGTLISGDVIFISRSTSKDSYDNGGWGSCMTVLTPSGVSGSPAGFLKLLTTDKQGGDGYNDASNDTECSSAFRDANYTSCFWGNSAAAPITSGTAGLILSANSSLTPQQVKFLIQDCADKIENSRANYSPVNGKSIGNTHGYGRLNAYEALKIASTNLDKGGRNGVDIFLRDHELDWGNTEKPSSYSFEPVRGTQAWWKSMDIKVDALADETPAITDNNFFEGFDDESPEAGKPNTVFVRVRNRGFKVTEMVTVNLYWVHAGAGLPPLPTGFWDMFPTLPSASPDWHLVGTKTLSGIRYSGGSTANNDAQVASFVFNAPVHDPSTRNHYCLMAIISSPDDKFPTEELKTNPEKLNMDYVTTHYNNATHRNYNIVTTASAFQTEFFMYNPSTEATSSKLDIIFKGQKIPVTISDSLEGKLVSLKKNEKKLVKLNIDPGTLKEPTEITIRQLIPDKKKGGFKIIGGINYLIVPPSTKPSSSKSKK